MKIQEMVELLYDKNTTLAYKNLQKLEEIAHKENSVYPYFNDFLEMLTHTNSFVRIRGFRLICQNARWDKENKINLSINKILHVLEEENPVAIRQYLQSIKEIVKEKRELNQLIKEKLLHFHYLKYKESMQKLIFKDIEQVIKQMT